jgi:hypothetical protein
MLIDGEVGEMHVGGLEVDAAGRLILARSQPGKALIKEIDLEGVN